MATCISCQSNQALTATILNRQVSTMAGNSQLQLMVSHCYSRTPCSAKYVLQQVTCDRTPNEETRQVNWKKQQPPQFVPGRMKIPSKSCSSPRGKYWSCTCKCRTKGVNQLNGTSLGRNAKHLLHLMFQAPSSFSHHWQL